jgi:hypothetical protein
MHGYVVALAVLSATVVPAGGALLAPPAGALLAPPAGLVSVLATGSSEGPGPGSIGVKLIALPGVTVDTFGRIYIVDRLPPGTTLHRQIDVSNTTSSTANVAVYAAGAGVTEGQFGFAAGRKENDLSSWTSVSKGVLHLLPGTAALETVTIAVPKDATAGERYAVVWAEVSSPPTTGGGVTLVNRVGVRMYVSIGTGGVPQPDFSVASLLATRLSTGVPVVTAQVRNDGPDTLDISGTLTLSRGPGGVSAGTFPVTLGVALPPGSNEPATVQLDKGLPSGPWRAEIHLASGTVQRTVTATITFPGKAVVAPAGSNGLIVIIVVVLLVLLLLALTAVVLLLRRRRVHMVGTP